MSEPVKTAFKICAVVLYMIFIALVSTFVVWECEECIVSDIDDCCSVAVVEEV